MPDGSGRFIDVGENPARPARRVVTPGHWNPFRRAWNASNRPLEAGLGAFVLFPNLWIALPFDSMRPEIFSTYLRIMDEVWWGLGGTFAGLLIWAGIYINGAVQSSPHLRKMGMILSCGIHSSMAYAWLSFTSIGGVTWMFYAVAAGLAFYCILNLSAHRNCRGTD